MKKSSIRLTTAQFANLHEVNKRTLHYYDTIGLFSPKEKGENGYRYYDISQSIDFEYIRMLKELNMSIDEIIAYVENPNSDKFIQIADIKEQELEKQIQSLKRTKKILQTKKAQVKFCENIQKQNIRIVDCKEEKLLVLPYDFSDDDFSSFFSYVKDTWSIEQIRMGIGGYISVDKVMKAEFEIYDGIYTPALPHSCVATAMIKPKGKYLCGYQKGTWDKLPEIYRKMLAYAEKNELKLTGYAYEMGLNEFVINNQEEYITHIMIKIEE